MDYEELYPIAKCESELRAYRRGRVLCSGIIIAGLCVALLMIWGTIWGQVLLPRMSDDAEIRHAIRLSFNWLAGFIYTADAAIVFFSVLFMLASSDELEKWNRRLKKAETAQPKITLSSSLIPSPDLTVTH